jgi:hypothetical protein
MCATLSTIATTAAAMPFRGLKTVQCCLAVCQSVDHRRPLTTVQSRMALDVSSTGVALTGLGCVLSPVRRSAPGVKGLLMICNSNTGTHPCVNIISYDTTTGEGPVAMLPADTGGYVGRHIDRQVGDMSPLLR